MESINNLEDIIDSRDIIERIEELGDLELDGSIDDDEKDELDALQALSEDALDYCEDWKYGTTLIRETYFTEYCEELCEEIGDIPKELPWYISNHIDWDGVAREIKMDYTEVDFDGVSYFVR